MTLDYRQQKIKTRQEEEEGEEEEEEGGDGVLSELSLISLSPRAEATDN